MAGLGFANPEKRRAQMLASLHGSTSPIATSAVPMEGQGRIPPPQPQMPQMPSPGAPAPGSVQPLPMPPYTPQTPNSPPDPGHVQPLPMQPFQPQAQAPAPDVEEDDADKPPWYKVVGAIGHVLLSADAGYRGAAMPESPFEGEQDQEMQVQEFVFNTAARAWEAMRNAPPENRAAMMEKFGEIIRKVAPDFDFTTFAEGMMSDPEKADMIAPTMAVLSEDAKSMFMARLRQMPGDSSQNAATLLQDDEFMQSLQDFDDKRNGAVLNFKMQKIRAVMVSMQMDPNTFEGMSPEDFARVNDQLPEKYRLTPSELGTLRRHPEHGSVIGMGGRPSGKDPDLDSSTGYRPPGRVPPRPSAVLEDDDEPTDGDEEDTPVPRAPSPRPSAPPRSGPTKPGGPSAPPRAPAAQPPAGGNPWMRQAQAKAGPARAPARPQAPTARAPAPVKPKAPLPSTPPTSGPASGPYYPPGWKPRTPKPRQEPVPVTKVEAVGHRPKKPAVAARPATTPAQPSRRTGEVRKVFPKDVTIPGFGPVKKGEALVYNYETGQWRRSK